MIISFDANLPIWRKVQFAKR